MSSFGIFGVSCDGGSAPLSDTLPVDFTTRSDHVGVYLNKYAASFVFDTFSEDFLTRGDILFLRDVPIPLRREDIDAFRSRDGLPVARVAGNMARVVGASPAFPYTKVYVEFLRRCMGEESASALVGEAESALKRGSYDAACILLRAALCAAPQNIAAMYGYARVCRDMYLAGDDEDYVGRFKAEALEYFELTTETYPSFPEAHYYLGYAYLNMGLYSKAHSVWMRYLKYSSHAEDCREIKARLRQLADPIKIECGCNAVLSGRFDEGRSFLEPYSENGYSDHWPLFYYLGMAYAGLARRDEAAAMFKRSLALNPSHTESMNELADIYETGGETELSEKYRRKADLIRRGGHTRERSEGG
ncbi:MAG: tetratricopeptide repeat protein [Clostridiales Family XIII bacterium]|jgi:tetratricopeptide (TPR) repeat protein|nr:tetratricopeptide repeat protein [Clostridiales Family XIII bacterium]